MNDGYMLEIMKESQKPEVSPAPVTTAQGLNPDTKRPSESGGPKGPEPTRYGDWERKGKCVDF